MTKGTPSFGKRNKKPTHVVCRRCGRPTYNSKKKYCVHCGFGKSKRLREYAWAKKD